MGSDPPLKNHKWLYIYSGTNTPREAIAPVGRSVRYSVKYDCEKVVRIHTHPNLRNFLDPHMAKIIIESDFRINIFGSCRFKPWKSFV